MTDLGRVGPDATVDAIIVAHTSAHFIKAPLQALRRGSSPNGRLIVSTGGGRTDGTSGIVSCFPQAIFITNDNQGFDAACNVDTRYSRSNYSASSILNGLVSTIRILISRYRTSHLKAVAGLWKP